jgi:hypothetical protein
LAIYNFAEVGFCRCYLSSLSLISDASNSNFGIQVKWRNYRDYGL